MEAIPAVSPGHYKPMKQFKPNRRCSSCNSVLSMYNSSNSCFIHQQPVFDRRKMRG